MAQAWTDDTYLGSRAGAVDLQNIENNFQTLRSLFSGGGAPTAPVAGQPWFDTDSADAVLKIRNRLNNAWLAVMYGNSNNKIWMYLNSATDGWVVWAGVPDRVLAVKGGSSYYNVVGGSVAGTWSQPGHTLSVAEMPSHRHAPQSGYATFFSSSGNTHGRAGDSYGTFSYTGYTGGNAAHNHGSVWRPAAAVGTIQYPKA